MWSTSLFIKRPKTSPQKLHTTFTQPLVLEKRDKKSLFDTMREYNVRPEYSPPKIRPLNGKLNKKFNLLILEEREEVKKELLENKKICIKFYNDPEFIEEILIKNENIENKSNTFSIGTWENKDNYIWDATDDNVEMEGWLVNNLMRFNFCIICLELP